MQKQYSRISLCLVHPEAKLEVIDASLREALTLDLTRFAGLHLHLLLITHAPAYRIVRYEAALEAHVENCITKFVPAEPLGHFEIRWCHNQ